MDPVFIYMLLTAVGIAFTVDRLWHKLRKYRESQIRNLVLPDEIFHKLREKHPQLSLLDCALVTDGLRQFFIAYLKSRRSYLAMPSQVVDDLWHEFILNTNAYQKFCRRAFGSFLHHVPTTTASKNKNGNRGIRRIWHYACKDEDIDPMKPKRLPLLFALDTQLNIVNGFTYVADCSSFLPAHATEASPYCATDLGSAGSGCGGVTCSGACGSDCGSGCGGGCSGGCGGGGGD